MKNLKTKVILSAFVLLFALVATIGSTYAWFTVSSTTAVNSLNVEVTSQESLLIRVWDGETESAGALVGTYDFGGGAATGSASDFTNTITTSLITATTTYSAFESYILTPVTAAGGPTTADATDYTTLDSDNLSTIDIGTTTDRTLTGATANSTTSTGGYIELKFWLMVQSGIDVGIQLSAFSATGSTVSQALYLGTKAATDSNEHIYAIDSDWGFVFGSTDTGYSATAALNSIPAGTITTLQGLEGTVNNSEAVVTLSANKPEIVTVRLWVEGWDAQADNSLMGLTTDVSFAFTII